MPSEEPTPAPADPPGPAAPVAASSKPAAQAPQQPRRWRMALVVVAVALILVIGIPRLLHALHTVSTDDAYVNSYVTFVAPRVLGQVARVLVDDNNRVKKGDVLVELDPEPYRVQVAIKQAAVDSAQAKFNVAQATVRSQVGQLRSLRFKLQHAIEDVHNQIAMVRARVATWEQTKATLTLAETEFERAKKLTATKVTSAEEFDQKVDMYGRKRKFDGRVSGFTMGTGSTLALLPPQNATGNFVKVVQRLPVRIDVVNYDSEKAPLFVGLSVEPVVDIKTPPTGPNAGKFLQESIPAVPAAKP